MDFVQVVAGQSFSCGIDIDQSVICWGGKIVTKNPPGLFKQLSADSSAQFACGILIDNSISCWGMIEEYAHNIIISFYFYIRYTFSLIGSDNCLKFCFIVK